MHILDTNLDPAAVNNLLDAACGKIPPLWPLESFVAVNPYMGWAHEEFEDTMHRLHALAGIQATLPPEFYSGQVDLPEGFRSGKRIGEGPRVKTYAEFIGERTGRDWQRFVAERVSNWAASYFDESQAAWNTGNQEAGPYKAWRLEASYDRSPEVMGLHGFHKKVRELPEDHIQLAVWALSELELPETCLETYLNALALRMPGWFGYAAKLDWESGLKGVEEHYRQQFLAIQLAWELCLKDSLKDPVSDTEWSAQWSGLELDQLNGFRDENLSRLLSLQKAHDLASHRALIHKINSAAAETVQNPKAKVQAIFCIDVRSEVFRRHLEATNPDIETLGFAGFFGFPIHFEPIGYEEGMDQCPALLAPNYRIKEGLQDDIQQRKVVGRRIEQRRISHAWQTFKQGAISCFSFVSPVGLAYLPKLLMNSFSLTRPASIPGHQGLNKKQIKAKTVILDQNVENNNGYGIPLAERVEMAESVLKAMSLTEHFSRIVLLTGHGSTSTNNPHASGLDCGACGGHSGEANAKVAAAIYNDPEVRRGLQQRGISIPESTLFLAALHDTTTDEVEIFNTDRIPPTHSGDLDELMKALNQAGASCRLERSTRFGISGPKTTQKIIERSKDWSQVRPEWGLAGCSAFIVAPRKRTAKLNLQGKAFLHNYEWRKDRDFGILELIMTAPMVVTSWINLQYYASTVDNKTFGSGNKTLHNVVGGLGVLEGYSGDLRCGLPWQSVHDGKTYQHDPLRLNVIIEAPVDEISRVLSKHAHIRDLCDNHWIFLHAMDRNGKVAHRYIGDLEWELI